MNTDSDGLLHRDLTKRIVGAFYDVYNELGYGFLESVYEGSMEIALRHAGLVVQRQVPVMVKFRGEQAGVFKADMLVEGKVLVELKAAKALEPAHEAQTLNYLKATEIEVALLFNFGPRPEFKRLVFDNERKAYRGRANANAARQS
jgi:GxxExxY protein